MINTKANYGARELATKFALYIALPSVKAILSDSSKFETLVSVLNRLGFQKVYIENYRDGQLLGVDDVARVRDMFEKEFSVAGGLAIGTWGFGMGRNADWWSVCACIDDEKNLQIFEKAIINQAKVFDEILIDDFWANWCYSKEQIEEFNKIYGLSLDSKQLRYLLSFDHEIARLWSEYSKSLLASASKRLYSKAKEINSNVKVVLKVAEWREQFLHRGLDLKLMTQIFDGLYIGTESREGTIRYGSLFIIDYVRALVGDKLKGAWFDSYNGLGIPTVITPEIFVEQLWYSFLGKVDEVTFFQGIEYVVQEVGEESKSVGSIPQSIESRADHVKLVERDLLLLKRIENLITDEKRGLVVPAIQIPIANPSDNYVEDVLGYMGIPITSKPIDKTAEGEVVLVKGFTTKYIDVDGLLRKGISIVLTTGAVEDLVKGVQSLDLIGVDKYAPIVKDVVDAVAFTDGKIISSRSHRRPHLYPLGPILNIDKNAIVHLYAVDKFGNRYPALYEIKYEKASIIVAPILKYPLALSSTFPEIARQTLRDVVAKFVGIKIETRQATSIDLNETSGVGLVLYKSKSIAITNENLHNKYFDLVIYKSVSGLTKLNGVVLGNARIEEVINSSDELRLRIRMSRHSIDAITFS